MKSKIIAGLMLVLVAFMIFFASAKVSSGSSFLEERAVVQTEIPIYECGILDQPNKEYLLMNDVSSSGTCFTITAKNVYLGLGYNSISGNGLGYGVLVRDQEFVTISGGEISNFDKGIYIDDSRRVLVGVSLIENNRHSGIEINGGEDNAVFASRINFHDGSDSGITIISSHNNIIHYSFFDGNDEGIYIAGGSGNIVENVEIKNSDGRGGLVLDNTFNNTIENSEFSNNNRDIFVYAYGKEYCDNEVVDVSGSNDGEPIVFYNERVNVEDLEVSQMILCDADGSTIKDVTLLRDDLNHSNGISILHTDNAVLSEINIDHSDYGIYLKNSNNNVIMDSYSTYSREGGITLDKSNGNSISSNTFSVNRDVGLILISSIGNYVEGNRITHNDEAGIFLEENSYSNLIYNNFFNNEYNVDVDEPVRNSWNLFQRILGPNKVGGEFLGGNYWAKPDRTGFSQTCEDVNEDGFCDEAYTIEENNLDYLPLTTQFADLDVSITITSTEPNVGDNVNALIKIRNLGNKSANFTFTSGVTWPGGGSGGGSCTNCLFLNPGEEYQTLQEITILRPGEYSVSSSVESLTFDPNLRNNRDVVVFNV